MNLTILPKPDELLDIAFRKARKKALELKSQRHALKDAKGRNITKIEASADYVSRRLKEATDGFPNMKKVNPFYRELITATIDLDETLKALGQMSAERKIIARLKGFYVWKVKALKKDEARKAGEASKEFYGRLSSLVKKLGKSIEKYNTAAKKLRELPSVKFDMPTAIIAGYPNTGKTTILGRLTKSQPKVAPYPFTTQKLQIGYLIHNYRGLQLVDTPGLLDRPLEKRNKTERKGIAALKHLAKAIVFVVDPTMQCGFSLEKQKRLLAGIEAELKGVPAIVVINKADLAGKDEMEKAKKAFPKAIVEGEGLESGLGEEIARHLL